MSIVSTPIAPRTPPLPAAAAVALACLLAAPAAAVAQTTDIVGVRAQGMAGAFTAVADDATAGFWNPAGLEGGPFVNGELEFTKPDRSLDGTTKGFTAAYPAFGVSYYRLPISQIRIKTSTATDPSSRKDEGDLSLYGATVGQSIGEHLVIGSTLKLLHAQDTSLDLDVGAMASFGPVRIGATLRNVAEPTLGSGADAFTLQRHARLGFALGSGRRGVIGSATLSVDADLTREQGANGDERFIAVGGEVWAPHNAIGIRGGVRRNTVGAEETMLAGGVSVAIKQSTFVDVYTTTGDTVRHGLGAALRVTF